MSIVFIITALLIVLYLLYPLWLMSRKGGAAVVHKSGDEINAVSLVLLSYNGLRFLEEKIRFLQSELADFKESELIIIDDCSTDGSREFLEQFSGLPGIRIVLKPERKGIPHTMNLAAELAGFNCMIFCDQRQSLSKHILRRIVEPFIDSRIGAVSACITHRNETGRDSGLRSHENFLKVAESRIGCLIGVYGPLYAVRKEAYVNIPEHIILDDLFLSLEILRTKQVVMLENCRIHDEGFSLLYDYSRTKRYLFGFLQILREKSLISTLNNRQLLMLLWHKYLRLLIPFFLFLSYIVTGVLAVDRPPLAVLFILQTGFALLAVHPVTMKLDFWFRDLVRINVFYFFAITEILFASFVIPGLSILIFNQKRKQRSNNH